MKSMTFNIVRSLLANRVGWFADRIAKEPDNALVMAGDMQSVSEALTDFLASATTQPAAIPANATSPRAEMLLSYLEQKGNALAELDEVMTQSTGNGSPAHKVIKRVRAFVSDPNATAI